MSDFFEGKPAWYRGYAETLAPHVIRQGRISTGPWRSERSAEAVHMDDCTVAEIFDLDEEVAAYLEADSYGGEFASLEASVSVTFTCACGKLAKARSSANSTLGDLISAVV